MDEKTRTPPAWLRFGVDGPDGIFLSDRALWSPRHREHGWQNQGTVGIDDWTERYLVAAFPLASTELRPCEVCGEPNALIVGAGVGNIIYVGDDLTEAERLYEDAFH